MTDTARVESVDALRAFQAALFKFAEAADVALIDAESEVRKTMVWLETEQDQYWRTQVRKWTEKVTAAREKVREKLTFTDSSGKPQSAIEEQKALKIAQMRLEEAEQKLAATRKWAKKLQKEAENYKGTVARFATAIAREVPRAAARLDRLAGVLDEYVSLTASVGSANEAASFDTAAMGSASVARSGAERLAAAEADVPGTMAFATGIQPRPGQVVLVRWEPGSSSPPPPDAFEVFDSAEAAEARARQQQPGAAVLLLCDHAGRVLRRLDAAQAP